MTCCSAASRFRYQRVTHVLYAASRFRDGNGDFKAVFAYQPVPEVLIAFVKGHIAKLRVHRVKPCGQSGCLCLVTRCVHRLKGIGVFSFFQSVKSQLIGFTVGLRGTSCHGKRCVSAAVLLNIERCHSFVVRIGKLDRQFLIPLSRILMICQYCGKVRVCGVFPLRIKGHILRQMICACFVCEMPCGRKSIVTIPALQSIALLHRILRSVNRLIPYLSGNRGDVTSAVCIKSNGQRPALRNRYLRLFSMGRDVGSLHPYQNIPGCKT